MRIAHIAPPWIPIPPKNYGGTENVIYNLVEAQIAQGHHVTLFAPADARTSARQISFFQSSLFESGVPWQAHLKAYYHTHKAVLYLKKHLQSFDVVHSHLSSPSDMYTFPLTEMLPLPQLTTLHSPFPFDSSGTWQGDADDFYMEWLSRTPLIAISKSALEHERAKFPLNFLGFVHHGLNLKDFISPREPDNYYVWLGRLVPEKGAHLAIKAAKKAGVRLVIAGIVDRNIPGALEYFQKQIEPQIDNQQIKYIGPVGRQKRNILLNRARAMLNPIQWEEPFGMVAGEAMANGCPVIAFKRGAMEEIITSEKVGFLVKTVAEMAERIPLVKNIDRHQVRAHIETFFSADKMARDYTSFYEKVIARSRNLTVPLLPPDDLKIEAGSPVN